VSFLFVSERGIINAPRPVSRAANVRKTQTLPAGANGRQGRQD